MKSAASLLSVLALAGCSSQSDPRIHAAEHAEKRLAIVQVSGSQADKCVAGRQVEEAWLDALDQQKYFEARKAADTMCADADLQTRLRAD